MILSILTPEGELLQKETERVTLPGSVGSFTVLKNHAPLIAALNAGDIVYVEDGEEKSQRIEGGFVRVLNNKVEVCSPK